MTKKIGPRLAQVEKDVARLGAQLDTSRKLNTVRRSARLAGAGAGIALYVLTGLNDVIGDAAQGIGTVYHDGKIAMQLLNRGASDTSLIDGYVAKLPDANERAFYKSYSDDVAFLPSLANASRQTLDSMGRESERFPGAQSKPIQEIRGLKEGLIAKGKKLIGKNSKEVDTTREPEYATHYNDIAQLRTETLRARNEVHKSMGELCFKMERNHLGGQSLTEGMEQLGELTRKYNQISALAERMNSLSVPEIKEGMHNVRYQEVITQAQAYGVTPFDGSSLYRWGALAGGAASAAVGYGAMRYVDDAVSTGIDVAKGILGVARGATRMVGSIGIGTGRAIAATYKHAKPTIGKAVHAIDSSLSSVGRPTRRSKK
jgi:hypothetical protein